VQPLLYDELVPFYPLLDPLEDHADEGAELGDRLRDAVPDAETLLELGAGAGHGAHFVKTRFRRATLTDVSASMLARSRALNPDCEHQAGDMRTLRLGRRFDCVLVHDAIAYITSAADLRAVATTVAEHLRSRGAALIVPDCTRESFVECHEVHAGDDGRRSLRALSWSYDPDPTDDVHLTDFAFLLREDGEVRAVHDRHVHGLFARSTWVSVFEAAGLRVRVDTRPLPPEYAGTAYCEEVFLCMKP
jgi:trans-aconitate methyltransferase